MHITTISHNVEDVDDPIEIKTPGVNVVSSNTKEKNSDTAQMFKKKLLPPKSMEKEFHCTICLTKFRTRSNLLRHMKIHTENRESSDCDICGKHVFDLKVHLNTHTDDNNKPYRCTVCPATFRKQQSMHDHSRKHNDNSKQLICAFCEIVVFSHQEHTRHLTKCTKSLPEAALEDSVRKRVNNRLRQCILCGTEVKNIKVHMKVHQRERPFKCTMCERTFTQTGHRNLHIRQVHPNSMNHSECGKCYRHFESLIDLDDHMKSHMTNNLKSCKISLFQKIVYSSNQRVTFKTNDTIHNSQYSDSTQAHRNHTDKHKPYKCNICPTFFHRKDHLEEHIGKCHTKMKPYKCKCCECCFFSSAASKRHMRLMHPNVEEKNTQKTQLCSVCGKEMNIKNMETHMRSHTGQKPFRCEICTAAFAQKNNLNNHMRLHTGQKPFRCEPCQKSFHSKNALNSHKRRHKPSD